MQECQSIISQYWLWRVKIVECPPLYIKPVLSCQSIYCVFHLVFLNDWFVFLKMVLHWLMSSTNHCTLYLQSKIVFDNTLQSGSQMINSQAPNVGRFSAWRVNLTKLSTTLAGKYLCQNGHTAKSIYHGHDRDIMVHSSLPWKLRNPHSNEQESLDFFKEFFWILKSYPICLNLGGYIYQSASLKFTIRGFK